MLERLGRWCATRHRRVLIIWVVLFIGLGVAASAHHGATRDTFSIPGTQSQQAVNLLNKSFPSAAGTSATVVYQAKSGTLDDPAAQAALAATTKRLLAIHGVASASSPLTPMPVGVSSAGGHVALVYGTPSLTANHQIGYTSVQFRQSITSPTLAKQLYEQLRTAVAPAQSTVGVQLGGPVVSAGNPPPAGISQYSEAIGLLCAVVILVVALGSVTSMAVPIAVALVSVSISKDLVEMLTASFTVGSVAPVLGSMIGLGVGIDYSLFIVSRYRQNLTNGMDTVDAVGASVATSGSAVLFAGLTVCLALFGLALVGIPYVGQMGAIAAMFVAVTMTAALTLVPALLGLLGPRINTLRVHRRDETADIHKTFSARWAAETSRHPVIFATVSLVVLLALAAPVLHLRLGFTDDGDLARSLTQRQAYDELTKSFGPGNNGPLLLAVDLPPVTKANAGAVVAAFSKLEAAVKATPGVARVSLPVPNAFPSSADPTAVPTAAIVQVVPTTAPNAAATAALVHRLREQVLPQALAGTALNPKDVFVGGATATLIDLTAALRGRIVIFIGGVIAGAFLLLMMVFRSLFVPAKAAVMNVLSILAAFGVIIAVFQWGWGKGLIGLTTTVPVIAFVPVMMFAVLFGLSMDYEVFLISRIKEEFDKSGDSRQSVVTGLAATARVITAAALIMISVFASFIPNPDPTIKMIGMGMAVAVFVDATIVRMVLVPSTMELAGQANWWLPRWLDRVLPHINVE